MKRLLVFVLCLALILPVMTAHAASVADVIGRWYLVSVDGNGLSGDNYIELNRNKSVTMVVKGQSVDTTGYEWRFADDEVKISQADSLISDFSLDYADGTLTLLTNKLSVVTGSSSYSDFVFAREPAVYYTPAMKAAAAEEEFFGEFELYLMETNGQYMNTDSDENGFDISLYVAKVYSEGLDPEEYLTNFENGQLIIYAQQDTIVSVTEDPDVLVTFAVGDPSNKAYLRRKGAAAPAVTPMPAAPASAVTPEPAAPATAVPAPAMPTMIPRVTAAPAAPAAVPEPTAAPAQATAEPKPEQPVKPVFPNMITPSGKTAPAEGIPLSAYYGTYTVYQDKLANGRTMDMTAYGLSAVIDANGVHISAYGQQVTVPYEFADSVMTANISAVYPDYCFASAVLSSPGELVVYLADATGYIGETLYLKTAD